MMNFSTKLRCCIAAILFGTAPLTQANPADLLGPDQWPETVDATVKMIISRLSEKDRLTVKNTKREDLILFHHGWGNGIRNDYGLWRGNKKLILSACDGQACHPDDASMKIIEAVWDELQKK